MESKKFLIILTFLISLTTLLTNEDRIIRLKDIEGENSYIPVRGGQKFTIEIEGNPTTGYQWQLELPEKLTNKKMIKPINLKENNTSDYYTRQRMSEDEVHALGVGGIYHFKFQANEEKEGMEELTFIYKRPWTDEDQIQKKVNLKVVKLDNDEL